MTIRDAVSADVPAIVEMAAAFVAETAYASHIALDPVRVAQLAEALIAAEDGVVLVAERAAALIGMLALKAFEHPMSGRRTVTEFVWWVKPEGRGSAGVRLLRAGEAWARGQHATTMQMIAPTQKVAQFYETCGYQLVEMAYARRLG